MRATRPIAAGLALLLAAPGGPETGPDGYALRLPIMPAGGAEVQRIVLPARVLAASRSPGLADLRVFDARGRPVPVARAAPPDAGVRRLALPALPILGARDALRVTGVTLRLERDGASRVARVEGEPTGDGQAVLIGVLFDPAGATGRAEALALDAVLPPGQPVRFVVEASEDLSRWRAAGERVLYRAPNMAPGGAGEAIALDTTLSPRSRLRVRWATESRPLAPIRVAGATLSVRGADAEVTTLPATPPPPGPDRQSIEFAVPFATPLATLSVETSRDDAILPVRVLGRNHAEAPWAELGRGLARSRPTPIALSGGAYRVLRIEADTRTAGFSAPPALRLGFAPAAIAFAAAGAAPYTLAIGREEASTQFLPLSDLAPALPLPDARLDVGAAPALALLAPDDRRTRRRDALLWGVLLAATAVLGAVAWRAWRSAPAD
jgi:hypothetical protein